MNKRLHMLMSVAVWVASGFTATMCVGASLVCAMISPANTGVTLLEIGGGSYRVYSRDASSTAFCMAADAQIAGAFVLNLADGRSLAYCGQ